MLRAADAAVHCVHVCGVALTRKQGAVVLQPTWTLSMKTFSETQQRLSANTVLQAGLLLLGAWIAQRERMQHWLVRQSAPLAQQGRTIRQPAAALYPHAPLAQQGLTTH